MTFEQFHKMAIENYDNGGDIIAEEYDEEDFNEWVESLETEPTLKDFIDLCKFYKECEDITHVRPKG